MSKVQIQIIIATVVCIIMTLPYYFQYDITICQDRQERCNCSVTFSSDGHRHLRPWWEHQMDETSQDPSQEHKRRANVTINDVNVTYWMHCLSEFQQSTLWDIWYILYEVSIWIEH